MTGLRSRFHPVRLQLEPLRLNFSSPMLLVAAMIDVRGEQEAFDVFAGWLLSSRSALAAPRWRLRESLRWFGPVSVANLYG